MVQEPPAATVWPITQVPPLRVKLLLFSEMPLTVRLPGAVLVKVVLMTAEVAPTAVSGKKREAGASVNVAAPVPVSAAVPLVPLMVTFSDAPLLPDDAGENATDNRQMLPFGVPPALQVLAVTFKNTQRIAALAGPLVCVHQPPHQ